MEKVKDKNFISVVVYIYNCEDLIQHFLEVIDQQISNHYNSYEFICVNDASTDNSIDRIRDYAKQGSAPVISIINMSYYQGIEASMNAGVDLAIGDFVYQFNTVYIEYDPDLIIKVYQKIQEGYDIISASKRKEKRLTTSIFHYLFDFDKINYLQNETFHVLSRRCINRIKGMEDTSVYWKVMYATCGLKNEVIYYLPVRPASALKTKTLKNARNNFVINSLLLYNHATYKFAVIASFILFIIFLGAGGYLLLSDQAFHAKAVSYLELILIIGQSGIFFLGAVLIKYFTLLIDLVFRKQRYIYDSIEKLI